MSINFPAADFHPQLAGYTGQGAFRFWCQKVLPIVYDDSLSYYELLGRVVNYLNNVIKDFGTLVDNLDEVIETFNQLQDWVNQYLDLDKAVADQLDKMAENGELERVFGDLIQAEIDQWLDLHPEATTTVQDGALTLPKFHESLKLRTVNGYVTPEMFGGVGDGVTDDTVAMQKALDAIHENTYNVNVLYLAKTYRVSHLCIVYSDTTIIGPGGVVGSDEDEAHGRFFYAVNEKNILIENVSFKTDAIDGGTFTPYSFGNVLVPGVISFNQCENVYVEGCRFEDVVAISCVNLRSCKYFKIGSNYINRYYYAGIDLCAPDCAYGEVVGNCVLEDLAWYAESRDYPGLHTSYPITLCRGDNVSAGVIRNYRIVCTDNYIFNTKPHWEGIDAHGLRESIISNNIIVNCACGIAIVPVDTTSGTQWQASDCRNVIISNNVCRVQNTTDKIGVNRNNIGIVVAGKSLGGSDIIVTGNTIEGFGANFPDNLETTPNLGNSGGIRIFGVDNSVVSNNQIFGCKGAGISVGKARQITVKANNIRNLANFLPNVKPSVVIYGILLDSGVVIGTITGNIIHSVFENCRCICGVPNAEASVGSDVRSFDNTFYGLYAIEYFSMKYMTIDIIGAGTALPFGVNTNARAGDIVRFSAPSNIEKLMPVSGSITIPAINGVTSPITVSISGEQLSSPTLSLKLVGRLCTTSGNPQDGTLAEWVPIHIM